MFSLSKGRYRVRLAATRADILAAQRLRHLAFVEARGLRREDDLDADDHDARCRHVLVEEERSGALVCCFRLIRLQGGEEIGRSYSVRHYDLSALARFAGPMAEIGRFCIQPNRRDADILRVAWGALTGFVDREGVEMLFGCSSFSGTATERYEDTFALLGERHLAPQRWCPRVKSPEVFRFARVLRHYKPDARRALRAMPPLLRSYLALGGRVSDHAVVDRELGTLHVFVGLEIRNVPPVRAKLLRAAAY